MIPVWQLYNYGTQERACQLPLVLIRTIISPAMACREVSHFSLSPGDLTASPVCLPESNEGAHAFQKGGGKEPSLSVLALGPQA